MALIEQHIEDCINLINEPHEKVHKWLDEYAKVFPVSVFNDYHRTFRHNSYGLKCIYGMWGKESYKAAKIHLIRDYDGKIENYNDDINKMMIWYDNPMNMEFIVHSSVIDGWLKEGFSLVTLATKDIINVYR